MGLSLETNEAGSQREDGSALWLVTNSLQWSFGGSVVLSAGFKGWGSCGGLG